jgi:hypothetical protein
MQKVVRTLLSFALAIGVVSATRSNAQDGRPNPGAVFVMTNAAVRTKSFLLEGQQMARYKKATDLQPAGAAVVVTTIRWNHKVL